MATFQEYTMLRETEAQRAQFVQGHSMDWEQNQGIMTSSPPVLTSRLHFSLAHSLIELMSLGAL